MAEVGVGVVAIRPDFSEFTGSKLSKGIDPAVDTAGKGIFSKFQGVFGKVAMMGGGILAGAAVGGFFKDAVTGARESAKISALTEQTIKSMGNAAGLSADQIGDLSTRMSNLTGVDDEVIQGGANLLLTFGNISSEGGVFEKTLGLANDMSVALGQDMKSSSIQLGKALNDPIKGVSALSRVGVSFTEQQKEQIKALTESGDLLGAQGIILDEVGKQFGGAAAAAATPMDRLKVTFGNLQEEVGARLLPVIDKLATFLADNLPGAIDWTMNAFGKVAGVIRPVIDAFGEKGLGGAATKLGGIVSDFLPVLIGKLGEWGQAFIGWIAPMIPPFLAEVGKLLERVGVWLIDEALPWLNVKLREWGAALVAWVAPRIPPLLLELGKLLLKVGEWLLTTALPNIIGKLAEWSKAFSSWVRGALADLLVKLGAFLLKIAGDAIDAVVGFVKGLPQRARDALSSTWRTFGDSWATAFTSVKTYVSDRINDVVGFVKDLPRRGRDALSSTWRTFADLWATAFTSVKTYVAERLAEVVDFFVKAPGRLRDAFSGAWRTFADLWATAFTSVKTYVSDRLADVVQFFTDLPGKMRDAISAGWETVVGIGRTIVDKLLQGIEALASGVGGLWEWATGLAGGLVERVGRGFERIVNLGKDIVKKIVEGIKSAPGAIADAVGGLFSGIKLPSLNLPNPFGDGPGDVPAGGGTGSARAMALNAVAAFGGRITSGYRSPAKNKSVGGSPTSYHVDSRNPAQDLVGPNMSGMFDFLYRNYGSSIREMIFGNRMVKHGRLMPYRRNDHWDHVHVAHTGGVVSPSWPTMPGLNADERPAVLQVGETVMPKGQGGFPGMAYWDEAGRRQARAYARELQLQSRAA